MMRPGHRLHRLPPAVFAELASGGGGTDAIHRLQAAQRSKNLMLLRLLTALTEASGHPDRAPVRAAYQALRTIQRRSPEAVLAALCYPPVSAWAKETVLSLRHERLAEARPGQLAAVAAVAAIRSGVAMEIDIPVAARAAAGPDVLLLPSLGTLALPAAVGTVRLRSSERGAEVRYGGVRVAVAGAPDRPATGWRPVPVVEIERRGRRLRLTLDAVGWRNVPRMVAAGGHPIESGAPDVPWWREQLAAAWDLLVRHHRPVAAEVAAALTVLVPLRGPRVGLHSGTFHDAFGSIAMSPPPDARLAAVAFAHEIQHAKLAALTDLYPFVEPAPHEHFYAPWRSDPRPLVGLLHGAYAHLGVAGFWRRQRLVERDAEEAKRAEVEFARWVAAAHDVTRVLTEHPRLTPVARRLVGAMSTVLEKWRREPVPVEAAMIAERLTEEHRRDWVRAHGEAGPPPWASRTV